MLLYLKVPWFIFSHFTSNTEVSLWKKMQRKMKRRCVNQGKEWRSYLTTYRNRSVELFYFCGSICWYFFSNAELFTFQYFTFRWSFTSVMWISIMTDFFAKRWRKIQTDVRFLNFVIVIISGLTYLCSCGKCFWIMLPERKLVG